MNCFIPACSFTKCSIWESVCCVIKISFYFLPVVPVPCCTNSAFSWLSDCLLALLILYKFTSLEVNYKCWKDSIIRKMLLFISPSIHKHPLSFHLKSAGRFILRFLPSLAISLVSAAPSLVKMAEPCCAAVMAAEWPGDLKKKTDVSINFCQNVIILGTGKQIEGEAEPDAWL